MWKSIKSLFIDIASVVNTSAETLNELSKAGRDNVKAMRVEHAIELEKEFEEKGYTADKVKSAIESRNEFFKALD